MIEILIQNIKNGKTYDISDLVKSVVWETDINLTAGSLNLEMLTDKQLTIQEGDVVRFTYQGIKIFFGKVFKKRKSTEGWTITCYDLLRYLKNKETMVLKELSSSELFQRICKEQKLPYKVVNKSSWKAPAIVHDDQSLFDILQNNLDKTLINKGDWFIIRDNFGKLEHVNINALVTNLIIGDESLAKDFDYESSIDESSNQVKLYQDNKDTNKRETYIVKDSKNIKYWGKLVYTEKVDEGLNMAQIIERANYIHKSLNKAKRTLKVPCVGVPYIRAGSGVVLMFQELIKEGFSKYQMAIVQKCSHTFDGDGHTMDLTLVVV